MEITLAYIVSQILVTIVYGLCAISFLSKHRSTILILNILADIIQVIAYILLKGYTGAVMVVVITIRDTYLYFKEKYNYSKKLDLVAFIFFNILTTVLAYFSCTGFESFLSVIATIVSTIAIWPSNVKLYKLLGIVNSIFWLAYNITLLSIMSIILESILLVSAIVGFIKECKKEKNMDKTDITINTYNNIVDKFIDYYKSQEGSGRVQYQREMDYIESFLDNGAHILDAGTAIGNYAKYLTENCDKDFQVIGIDGAENMLECARKRVPKAKFEKMDVRNITYPDNSFDAILCIALLLHLNDSDAIKVLNRFKNLLKDNGIIVITTLEENGTEKETFTNEPLNPKYKTYFNRYTKEFFIDYLTKNGFIIKEIYDNSLYDESKAGEDFVGNNIFSIIAIKESNR